MQILEGGDFRALIQQSANSPGGSVSCGERRDAWDVVANGRAANRLFVVERFAAQGRVDHQIDLAGFDQVNDIRAAFVYFENRFRWNACGFERRGGPARSE